MQNFSGLFSLSPNVLPLHPVSPVSKLTSPKASDWNNVKTNLSPFPQRRVRVEIFKIYFLTTVMPERKERQTLNWMCYFFFFSLLHLHVEVHVQREELGVRADNVVQPPPTTSCRAYRWQKATQVWLSRRPVPPAGHRNQFQVKSVLFLGGGHRFGDAAPDEDIWPAGPRLAVRPGR